MALGSRLFDLTIPVKGYNIEGIKAWIEKYCERGAIAKEMGANGYWHYQTRIFLKQESCKERLVQLFPNAEVSNTHVSDFDYIMKTVKEGRGDEVWTTDDTVLEKYKKLDLREWQKDAYQRYMNQDDRQITVISDLCGNTGKSWLGKYIVSRREGHYIPAIGDGRNLIQTVFGAGSAMGGYVIDIPRSQSVTKGFWEMIEQIKNGFLYETRYAFSSKWIEPPRILVTTNLDFVGKGKQKLLEGLSADRWDIVVP